MPKIILASTSPRRAEMLKKTGLQFKAVSSNYEEDMTLKLSPLALARKLSRGKAEAVKNKYNNHIIIGADSFLVLDNELLGKPLTPARARKMLRQISGRCLLGITGFTIINSKTGKSISKAVTAKVYIRKLTPSEINNYVKTGEPLDKAGAFAVQELGSVIVKKVEGSFLSIVGFPLYEIAQELKKFGIRIL